MNWDEPGYTDVGNLLLSRVMGADSRLDPAGFDIGIRASWTDALREVEEAGGTPYGIPAGASEHPLGGLGFAGWAYEVAEQERELDVFFDTIVVCTVTGSTHAGMIAGFAALEDAGGRAAPGPRHRRLRDDRQDPRPGRADRPAHRRPHRARARAARRRDHRARGLGRRRVRRPGRLDDRGDPAQRPPRGDDHRPRVRGEVDGRPGRPRHQRRDRPRLDRPLRPPRRPAGAQRVRGLFPADRSVQADALPLQLGLHRGRSTAANGTPARADRAAARPAPWPARRSRTCCASPRARSGRRRSRVRRRAGCSTPCGSRAR